MSDENIEIETKIKAFIAQNILFKPDGFAYPNDASFLEEGIIDSIGVMELAAFVNQTFQMEVPPEDILPDNFDSVDKLVSYIRRKQQPESA